MPTLEEKLQKKYGHIGTSSSPEEAAAAVHRPDEVKQATIGLKVGPAKDGKGVTPNYKKAYVWLSLAAAHGGKDSIKNRDITAKILTPQQLSEAQELVAQMQEKIDSIKK